MLANVGLGGNVAALRMIKQPRKMLYYCGETIFLYKTLTDSRGLPQRNIYDIFGSEGVQEIRLAGLGRAGGSTVSASAWLRGEQESADGLPYWRQGASYITDLVNLCLLCQIKKPEKVFEIGTLDGFSALHFAWNTPDDSRIYTLDLPRDSSLLPVLNTTIVDDSIVAEYLRQEGYCFANDEVAHKIVCLQGDSALFDFSPHFGSVDLFYVDGSHSYEYVRSDTINALRCCRPGGVIAWHDFGRMGVNGVSRWLLALSKTRTIYATPGGSLAFMEVE